MARTHYETKLLADGMVFGESPRWHDGTLYMSDMTGKKLIAIDQSGKKNVLREDPNQFNGISFNDDGILIYATMFDQKLWSYDPKTGHHSHYADLSALMTGYTGDVVIDAKGRVYVDDVGARVLHGETPRPGRVLLVAEDRSVHLAYDDSLFPNGICIDSTGSYVYLIESFAYTLSRFKIRADGTLYDRMVVWDFKDYPPPSSDELGRFHTGDGCCMDAEDCVWVSMLQWRKFVRFDPASSTITDVIDVDGDATACTLGGPDGKTLFMVVNDVPLEGSLFDHMIAKRTKCSVYTTHVDVGKGKARP